MKLFASKKKKKKSLYSVRGPAAQQQRVIARHGNLYLML